MRSLLAAALIFSGCRAPSAEPPSPYHLEAGAVVFTPGAPFLSRLEIIEVGAAAQASAELRSVGQIIALSNRSGNLVGDGVGWVELDPRLTASAGLELDGGLPPGTAYGLTNVSPDYRGRVGIGHRVEVRRYGLRKSSVSAVIVKLLPREGDGIDVVFRFSHAEDWFPGTNAEISFPLISGRPVKIPTTAPIHEGVREYVWKETAPGRFAPQTVSLIDSTPDEASVLGLAPGDRIVGRGAILLKPLLDELRAEGND